MKSFESMRYVAATGAILMVPSSFFLRYLFTHKIPYSDKAIYEQAVYGVVTCALANFAEGMFMIPVGTFSGDMSSYLPLLECTILVS